MSFCLISMLTIVNYDLSTINNFKLIYASNDFKHTCAYVN